MYYILHDCRNFYRSKRICKSTIHYVIDRYIYVKYICCLIYIYRRKRICKSTIHYVTDRYMWNISCLMAFNKKIKTLKSKKQFYLFQDALGRTKIWKLPNMLWFILQVKTALEMSWNPNIFFALTQAYSFSGIT